MRLENKEWYIFIYKYILTKYLHSLEKKHNLCALFSLKFQCKKSLFKFGLGIGECGLERSSRKRKVGCSNRSRDRQVVKTGSDSATDNDCH